MQGSGSNTLVRALVISALVIGCGGDPENAAAQVDAPGAADEQPLVASAQVEPAARAAESVPPVGAQPAAARGIEAALLEYRRAFEARDLPRLEAIWTMNPIERALIERAWENCEHISLAYNIGEVKADAGKGSADFVQTLRFRCPAEGSSSASRLRATLVRSGSGWTISGIADRDRPLPAPRRASAQGAASGRTAAKIPGGASGRERAALTTLNEYGAALSTCDLTALSRVWIMNPLERQILHGVCFQNRQLAVSITEPRVFDSAEQLRVEFTQALAYRGSSGARQTRSALTALLVQRDDGGWAIWKIRASN